MRAFLAVHPGDEFRAALSRRVDPWRDRIPVKWTRPETWHLTLQFLGEWPAERLEALQERLFGLIDGTVPDTREWLTFVDFD